MSALIYSLISLISFSAIASGVQSADLNTLDLDSNPTVVTNVDLSGLATSQDINNAISTNNDNFVDSVLNTEVKVPAGVDIGDLSAYGTIGALLVALALAVKSMKGDISNKADSSDLGYSISFRPDESWEISGVPASVASRLAVVWNADEEAWDIYVDGLQNTRTYDVPKTSLEVDFGFVTVDDVTYDTVLATRSTISSRFSLLDRSMNEILVSSESNIYLPHSDWINWIINPRSRDFIVTVDISSDVSDVSGILRFEEQNEFGGPKYFVNGSYSSNASFPMPTEIGKWSYSFTEFGRGEFAVSLIKLDRVIDDSSSSSSPAGE